VPLIISLFVAIKRHYAKVDTALTVTPQQLRPEGLNHTVVVLVGRIHRGVLKALWYAKSLRPQHLVAVYVASDDDARVSMERQWERFGIDVPLEIVHSPYRQLVDPVDRFIHELDTRWPNDTITVVIPEFVVSKWYQAALHNQSALRLKGALLFREGVVVTSVPYHVESAEAEEHRREVEEHGAEWWTDAAPRR